MTEVAEGFNLEVKRALRHFALARLKEIREDPERRVFETVDTGIRVYYEGPQPEQLKLELNTVGQNKEDPRES